MADTILIVAAPYSRAGERLHDAAELQPPCRAAVPSSGYFSPVRNADGTPELSYRRTLKRMALLWYDDARAVERSEISATLLICNRRAISCALESLNPKQLSMCDGLAIELIYVLSSVSSAFAFVMLSRHYLIRVARGSAVQISIPCCHINSAQAILNVDSWCLACSGSISVGRAYAQELLPRNLLSRGATGRQGRLHPTPLSEVRLFLR